MAEEGAVRRRRRSHLVIAASVAGLIVSLGFALQFMPGSGPEIGTVQPPQQKAATKNVTPFGQAFARGIEAMRLGDAHAAALAFDDARAINPHVAEAHINLGFAYLALSRPSEAATAFDRGLTVDPKKTNAYYGLGVALDAAGDRGGAMGAMRTYVHLAAQDDPFRRKAMSALWEWEAAEKDVAAKKGEGGAKTDTADAKPEAGATAAATPDSGHAATPPATTAALNAKPAAPRDASALAPLPAIADTPDALTPPAGMISIVNFWASWCGPCRAEMPSLQSFAASLDPTRYRLVGLNIDKDRDFAREFIRDTGVSFGNFWDGKGTFARERFQVESYPQTLFLDASGTVIARVVGAREWPAAAAEHTVAELLAAHRQKTELK